MSITSYTADTSPYSLAIISTNRVNFPYSRSDKFRIQFQYPLLYANGVSLRTCCIPNSIIVFNHANTYGYRQNSWIDFIDSSTTQKSAQIPEGTYTESQFVAIIKSIMDTASGLDTYTVTVDPNTKLLNITSSSATFQILWATGTHASSSMYYEMGFNPVDTATAASQTGVRIIQLSGPYSLYLQFDAIKNIIHDTKLFTASYQIPMDVSFGGIKYWKENSEYNTSFDIQLKNITYLDVSIVSDFGNVNLQNADWSCLLEFKQT